MNFKHMPELEWPYGLPFRIGADVGCLSGAVSTVPSPRLVLDLG